MLKAIKGEGKKQYRRWCYHIIVDQFDENGYIPSIVTEGQPGHQPMTGGEGGTPYYWGKTYPEARKACRQANERLGYSESDTSHIVTSSIHALQPIRD